MGQTNALITVGILVGSFMIVACFAFVIQRMARARQIERLEMGMAFAMVRREQTRFWGEVKRLTITGKRPAPETMFELQDYFASKECGKNFEADAIKYTFKTMQMLGYEVRLFYAPPSPNDPAIEVDLSKIRIRPCKEIKKEIKRAKKLQQANIADQNPHEDESDEYEDEERKNQIPPRGNGNEGDFSSISQNNSSSIPQPRLRDPPTAPQGRQQPSQSPSKNKKRQSTGDEGSSSSSSYDNGDSSDDDDDSSSSSSEGGGRQPRLPSSPLPKRQRKNNYNLTDNDDQEDYKERSPGTTSKLNHEDRMRQAESNLRGQPFPNRQPTKADFLQQYKQAERAFYQQQVKQGMQPVLVPQQQQQKTNPLQLQANKNITNRQSNLGASPQIQQVTKKMSVGVAVTPDTTIGQPQVFPPNLNDVSNMLDTSHNNLVAYDQLFQPATSIKSQQRGKKGKKKRQQHNPLSSDLPLGAEEQIPNSQFNVQPIVIEREDTDGVKEEDQNDMNRGQ